MIVTAKLMLVTLAPGICRWDYESKIEILAPTWPHYMPPRPVVRSLVKISVDRSMMM